MTPQETEPKLYARVGGPPVEAWVSRGSPQGWGHWKVPLGVTPIGVHYLPHHRAYRGREDQPHIQGAMAALAPEGLEELSHVEGQEGQR